MTPAASGVFRVAPFKRTETPVEHLDGRRGRGVPRCVTRKEYGAARRSEYARIMATWPGFKNKGHFFDHEVRYTPRDYPIFAAMKPGDQYPQAYSIAEKLFKEELRRRRRNGQRITEGGPDYLLLRKQFVPPYDPNKYPNKWIKMRADMPVRTIPAHLGKDSYSHIHYDSSQLRSISIREAARLQSFPDGFEFAGTFNPRGRQIGNSVPPRLALAIARNLIKQIRNVSPVLEKERKKRKAKAVVTQAI